VLKLIEKEIGLMLGLLMRLSSELQEKVNAQRTAIKSPLFKISIEVLEYQFKEVLELIKKGEIKDAKTIMLLQYAQINLENLMK